MGHSDDMQWQARATVTWKRHREMLLPRLEAGESTVQAVMHEPKPSTASVRFDAVSQEDPIDLVVFTRESMVDGYDVYAWAEGRTPQPVEIGVVSSAPRAPVMARSY